MLYAPRSKLAFVHIHKTGGLSLRHYLLKNVRDLAELPDLPGPHRPLAELHGVLRARGVDPSRVAVLTVLRDPLSHAVSVYEFWRSDKLPQAQRELPRVALTRRLSFRDFLFQVLVVDPFGRMLLVDGALPANVHVLRLENLAEEGSQMLRRLGFKPRGEIGHENATPHPPYQHYYDDECEAQVRRTYRWCYEAGYYA
jgi:hypothetical protein